MNIKIQGGGSGTYANTGSCFGVVSYLRHEDAKRQEQGEQVEPFFNQRGTVTSREVTEKIDNNRAKLGGDDAKFYVITVSPSQKELQAMGKTPQEQVQNFREYINSDVMQRYGEGFNKGMGKDDIMYYGKIHHERKAGGESDMHAHIIVSRKDISNTKKISPQTNHRGNSKGAVKSGFNRSEFFRDMEKKFDNRFNHSRDYRESYEYQNAMKNGTIEQKQEAIKEAVQQEKTTGTEQNREQQQERTQQKEIKQEQQQSKGLRL
ncbi:hypothetical protein EZS27_019896 [termite gut metagenome]|uniref:Clindamycin resistance transfer factor BtgB n=1 Tax=termite gut metagenome TaxID=433724 RepID=A0A5J4RDV3_9ZZZZ